mgnify:CR=1 FL=1
MRIVLKDFSRPQCGDSRMKKDKGQAYWAKLAAITQYLALTKAIEASEKADTRYWSSLPSTIHLADTFLKKGNYRAQVVISRTDLSQVNSRIYPLGTFKVEKENQKLMGLLCQE